MNRTETSSRMCTVPNCDRVHYAFDLCNMHWARMRRNGSTELPPASAVTPLGGDNVRIVAGRRRCKQCELIHGAATRQRRRAAA